MERDIIALIGGPINSEIKATYKTVILKGNLSFKDLVNSPNTKYIIRYDFDLNGETVEIPENCILYFDGGSLSNGTLDCEDTLFYSLTDKDTVLYNINLEGNYYWDLEHVLNKDYEPEIYSGLGRIYLKRNIVNGWPHSRWMYAVRNGDAYLLYSYKGKLYAVYNEDSDEGLGLVDNLVVKLNNYNINNIESLVQGRYLSFTKENNIYIINKPDETTITNIELNNTNIYKIGSDNVYHKGINLLTQDMINKPYTIYYILYDYDLNGETLYVPEGCILIFDGGSIDNGTIVGAEDSFITPCYKYIGNVNLEGFKVLNEPLFWNGVEWVEIGNNIVEPLEFTIQEKDIAIINILDKKYIEGTDNGMGMHYVPKNEDENGKNILYLDMIPDTNTIYVIRYDFTLGEDITVPENCIFRFDGGSLKGGDLIVEEGELRNKKFILDNTMFENNVILENDITFSGTCSNSTFYHRWFKNNDINAFLDFALNVETTSDSYSLTFESGTYYPYKKFVRKEEYNKDVVINGNNATLIYNFDHLPPDGTKSETIFYFYGKLTDATLHRITKDVNYGDYEIEVEDTNGLKNGDYIVIRDSRISSYNWARNYLHGEFVKIKNIKNSNEGKKIIVTDLKIYGTYKSVNANEYSKGSFVVKVDFRNLTVNNLTILTDKYYSGFIGNRGLVCYLYKLRLSNVTIKGLNYCVNMYYCINSSVVNCTLHSNPYKETGKDQYGLMIANSLNIDISGGDYRGGNHGIATGGSYGSNINPDGTYSSINLYAIICRFIYIHDTFTLSYGFGSGLNCHENSEYFVITNNNSDGLSVSCDNSIISNNIVKGNITIGSIYKNNLRISNNTCLNMSLSYGNLRKNSNNPTQVSYLNLTLGSIYIEIRNNKVADTITVSYVQNLNSLYYGYSTRRSNAVLEVLNAIKTYEAENLNTNWREGSVWNTVSESKAKEIQKETEKGWLTSYYDRNIPYMSDGKIIIEGNVCSYISNQILFRNNYTYMKDGKSILYNGKILGDASLSDFKNLNDLEEGERDYLLDLLFDHNLYALDKNGNKILMLDTDGNPVKDEYGLPIYTPNTSYLTDTNNLKNEYLTTEDGIQDNILFICRYNNFTRFKTQTYNKDIAIICDNIIDGKRLIDSGLLSNLPDETKATWLNEGFKYYCTDCDVYLTYKRLLKNVITLSISNKDLYSGRKKNNGGINRLTIEHNFQYEKNYAIQHSRSYTHIYFSKLPLNQLGLPNLPGEFDSDDERNITDSELANYNNFLTLKTNDGTLIPIKFNTEYFTDIELPDLSEYRYIFVDNCTGVSIGTLYIDEVRKAWVLDDNGKEVNITINSKNLRVVSLATNDEEVVLEIPTTGLLSELPDESVFDLYNGFRYYCTDYNVWLTFTEKHSIVFSSGLISNKDKYPNKEGINKVMFVHNLQNGLKYDYKVNRSTTKVYFSRVGNILDLELDEFDINSDRYANNWFTNPTNGHDNVNLINEDVNKYEASLQENVNNLNLSLIKTYKYANYYDLEIPVDLELYKYIYIDNCLSNSNTSVTIRKIEYIWIQEDNNSLVLILIAGNGKRNISLVPVAGNISNKPSSEYIQDGFKYLCTNSENSGQLITYYNNNWYNPFSSVKTKNYGGISSAPLNPPIGTLWFCTLGRPSFIPIVWNGDIWLNYDGYEERSSGFYHIGPDSSKPTHATTTLTDNNGVETTIITAYLPLYHKYYAFDTNKTYTYGKLSEIITTPTNNTDKKTQIIPNPYVKDLQIAIFKSRSYNKFYFSKTDDITEENKKGYILNGTLLEVMKNTFSFFIDIFAPDPEVYRYMYFENGGASVSNFRTAKVIQKWYEEDGAVARVSRRGSIDNLPNPDDIYVGFLYICTDSTNKGKILTYFGDNKWYFSDGTPLGGENDTDPGSEDELEY